jgi:hypothetical protein
MKDNNFDFRFAICDSRFGKLKIFASLWFILSLAIVSTGCSRHGLSASSGQYYSRETAKNLSTIRTVCLVELHNNATYPQISGDVTDSLYQTLQKKQLFSLSLLRQTDTAWKTLEIQPGSPYTLEQLLAARKMLGVDAALVGTVTSYTPYPHMAMGLQLKLIDLRDGQVVWAVEQIWDTADKATEERIKKYFEKQLRSGFSPLGEQLAAISSINFVRFVTYDATEAL